MVFWEKLKIWLKEKGWKNLLFLGVGFAAKVLLGSNLLLGACLGIFVFSNWKIIKELYSQTVEEYNKNKEELKKFLKVKNN